MRLLFSFACVFIYFHSSVGQGLTDDMKDQEEQFRASTKQINQFFRRFNGEEDQNGNRYTPSDNQYRSGSVRKKFLPNLFDQENSSLENPAKQFVKEVSEKRDPKFLDFHKNDWLAEVQTVFTYNSKEVYGLLYMKLQKQGQGYEWVIDQVSFDIFQRYFNKDTSESKRFIHPMSHELDFMTLRKALDGEKHAEQFTPRSFYPDQLTLFLYEMNKGNLKFKTVKSTKFHFFTIEGWYFSIANFNRSGYNSGWLIDNLVQLQNDQHKQAMINYIYDIR